MEVVLSVRVLFATLVLLIFLFLYGCPAPSEAQGATPACGDGKLDAGEMCEKNADCKDEALECRFCTCKLKVAETAGTPPAVCGNGKVETLEQCEKEADCASGKACDKCKCVEKKPQGNGTPTPVCGNSKLETGEVCEKDTDCNDDGKICDSCACKVKPTQAATAPSCGNGLLDSGEECDVGTKGKPAGNSCPSGEYCSSCKCYTAAEPVSCKLNHQYAQSTGINQFIWTTLPSCGDDCDYLGVDYKCDLKTCTCMLKDVTSHTCGNNIKESVEECDGIDNSWCSSTQICGQGCTCVNGTHGVCGNGAREGNEQCDGADRGLCTAAQTCSANCLCLNAAAQAACGNGMREGTEQCDGADDAGCAAGYACSANCVCVWGSGASQQQSICGNSVREGLEECDGNDRGVCTSSQTCTANCVCQAQQQPLCGNNVREGNEQCDGSDRTACSSNQTCNMNCLCQAVQQQQSCGNNVREGNEQCDGTDKALCSAGYYCSQNCACLCTDDDADLVCNSVDNCPANYNPGQGDRDGDGIGDECDTVPANCQVECSAIGLTNYAQGQNSNAVCNAKIQQDLQAAMAALQAQQCFTTCRYAESNSTYLSITMNQVSFGCCCLGPISAWKEEFACTDCPGQNPVCPPAEQVCSQ